MDVFLRVLQSATHWLALMSANPKSKSASAIGNREKIQSASAIGNRKNQGVLEMSATLKISEYMKLLWDFQDCKIIVNVKKQKQNSNWDGWVHSNKVANVYNISGIIEK